MHLPSFLRLTLPGCFLLAMIAVTVAMPAFAEAATDEHELAAQDFRSNCAACHGETGIGDGPVAGVLIVRPPDLTLMAQRNGGTFPTEAVYKRIYGLDMPQSHGTREMPVWGLWFSSDAIAESLHTGDTTLPPEKVEKRIRALVGYLESIQQ